MKITVVGAGAVGATVADNIARKELCRGTDTRGHQRRRRRGQSDGHDADHTPLLGSDTKIIGSTNDYSKTQGSHVAVITSGIPRKNQA